MINIAIASDHAGYELKSFLIANFGKIKGDYNLFDAGCDNSTTSVDYPDLANIVTDKITSNEADFGILICGTGIGISIAANRSSKIRAALCLSQKMAKLSRQHNDANVICLGARLISDQKALKYVETFLNTKFKGGRHIKRVQKLSQ